MKYIELFNLAGTIRNSKRARINVYEPKDCGIGRSYRVLEILYQRNNFSKVKCFFIEVDDTLKTISEQKAQDLRYAFSLILKDEYQGPEDASRYLGKLIETQEIFEAYREYRKQYERGEER